MKAKLHFLLSVITVLMTLTTVNCSKGGSDSGSSAPAAVNPALYGTSCGVNSLNSQWGCLPQCGPRSVTYQGQCQLISTSYGNGIGGSQSVDPNMPIAPGASNPQMCQGTCGTGNVSVSGGQCLPQYSCGPCYGYYRGQCYIGDYAHQYYGM